jgi:septal ring factor EnvC (AmiA/AmiB activator)
MIRFLMVFVVAASLAVAADVEPKISDATHAKIRDIQLQQKSIEAQYLRTQQQLAALEKQYNETGTGLAKALDEAYKEAKAKPEEWSLNPETLQFTKITKAETPKK